MIVDSSAIVAVAENEPDAEVFFRLISDSDSRPRISAGTLLETSIVLDRRHATRTSRQFDELVFSWDLEVVPVDADHVRVARAAYRDFGRGSGHRANLNFGDCFSYALASITGEPLLYKGDDFSHTDVRSALA